MLGERQRLVIVDFKTDRVWGRSFRPAPGQL